MIDFDTIILVLSILGAFAAIYKKLDMVYKDLNKQKALARIVHPDECNALKI